MDINQLEVLVTVAREKNRVFIQVAERGFLAAAGQRADAAAF